MSMVWIVWLLYQGLSLVSGHGRLWDPPGRSTMWRRGFETPVNYQDNELFCGGFQHQVSQGYKCGLCGDAYDGVRHNEAGGKYATGVIAKTYTQGQRTTFQIDLTAPHKGFFEFRICPTNDPTIKETQECFDKYLVKMADGSGTKFYPEGTQIYTIPVVLPRNLTCQFCVLQWQYHTGNSWGRDPDGRECIGCGPQEEFYGCANIEILPGDGSPVEEVQETPSPTIENNVEVSPTEKVSPGETTGEEVSPEETTGQEIRPEETTGVEVPSYQAAGENEAVTKVSVEFQKCRGRTGEASLDQWCLVNCQAGYCPSSHCTCQGGDLEAACKAIGSFELLGGSDEWCRNNCALGHCPADMCQC